MRYTSITQFKKFLNEAYSSQDARDTFEGVLGSNIVTDIESKFKTEYGIVTNNDSYMYYIQLYNQQGQIVDRIVYTPSEDMNERWTATSTAQQQHISFEKWNQLVEWFNNQHETKLPTLTVNENIYRPKMYRPKTHTEPKTKIGELYFPGEMFVDKANQTIGKPLLPNDVMGQTEQDILNNRKRVTKTLTAEGLAAMNDVKEEFKKRYGIEVSFKWNVYCGCSQCPCSPGYDIIVNAKGYQRFKESDRFNIWVRENGSLDFREPKDKWVFDSLLQNIKK